MTDHLSGTSGYTHELLAELSDEQLAEQIEFYRQERSSGLTNVSYQATNHLAAALREQESR